MFKTCVSITTFGKMPEVVKGVIEANNWEISTIVSKPDYVRLYFTYKWYQWIRVNKFKQKVKNFEERIIYYDKPDIPGYLFAKETKHYSDQYKEALTRFAYAAVQGDPEGRDGEAITNEKGVVIGYKK